jgi:membrane-bound lytic murein transglycosylase D
MRREKFIFLGLISILFLAGCSSSLIKSRVVNPPPKIESSSMDATGAVNDSTSALENTPKDEFEEVEFYYALGVASNQEGKWLEAQEQFEQALEILANLDLEEADSLSEHRVQKLLNEIAGDYKLTLLSLGILSDESSISAFRERFENVENFKSLQKRTEFNVVPPTREATYDMPIVWNERVENAVIYFQTVGRKAFTTYMKRSGKYKDLMQKILRERGLPEDLVWLCLVESGFNPKAYSWARAVGPWQFIAGTGRKYGLKRNWWYDERRDFVKSTYAACDYLTFLYNKFNSWPLALAGYNGGEGRVEKAIKKHKTDDFWRLKLRKQTEDYVPLYMAATIIAKDPKRYGLDLEFDEPLSFDEVEINQPVDLKKVSKIVGTSPDAIRELNPELLRGVTPPNYHGYKLRIPAGKAELFAQGFPEADAKASGLFVEHKVTSGQTLSHLSQKYGVPISAIMEMNGLTNKHRLSVGQRLIIPAHTTMTDAGLKVSSKRGEKKKSASTTYTVKKGDTLSELALKFNTSPQELKRLNGLKNTDRINKGQKLLIPQESPAPTKVLKEHIVKKGETLWYLATEYGVSVSAIMSANNLSNAHRLKVGQPLMIPVTSESAAALQSYVVKKGDTLSDLAQKFRTDTEEIKKANDLSNADYVKAGQKLNIPIQNVGASKEEMAGRWITYVVKKGDTLWDIARAFGVMLEKLMSWNNLGAHSKLRIGDRIRIFLTN